MDNLQDVSFTGVLDLKNELHEWAEPANTRCNVVEEEVRKPSFTVDVIQNGKTVTVNGKLNYYGKGAKCSGPRYFDPIIVSWGQVNTHPALNSDNTFTSTHEYNVKNKDYNLYVRATNSCFGSYSFHKTDVSTIKVIHIA